MRKLILKSVTLKTLEQADDLAVVVGGVRPNPGPSPDARLSRRPIICHRSLGCTASPE
jgi:hypothetical protein